MKTHFLLLALLVAQTLHAQWEQLPSPDNGPVEWLGTVDNRVWAKSHPRNYVSDDQGLTWQRWLLQDTLEAASIWLSNNELLTFGARSTVSPGDVEETIFRSTDNGDSWQAIFYDTLRQYRVSNIFGAGGYLFMASANGWQGYWLYRSSDKGKTWQKMDVDGSGVGSLHLLSVTAGGDTLLASLYYNFGDGTSYGYLRQSTDFGQTWQPANSIGISPDNGYYRIMGNCWVFQKNNTPSISISFDSGITFTEAPDPCPDNLSFFALPNTLYAYGQNCLSRWNAGTGWQPILQPPLPFISFVQSSNGVMLAAGSFKIMRFAPSSYLPVPDEALALTLFTVPNPAHQSVEVTWPDDAPRGTPLFVYDVCGKLVWQEANWNSSSKVKVDISSWPPGFYALKVGRYAARLVKN